MLNDAFDHPHFESHRTFPTLEPEVLPFSDSALIDALPIILMPELNMSTVLTLSVNFF